MLHLPASLRAEMHRSSLALEAFSVGNLAWMAATVGLVFQEAESQLCLSYLADSQQRAGRGLVVVAVALVIAWLALRARLFLRDVSAGVD